MKSSSVSRSSASNDETRPAFATALLTAICGRSVAGLPTPGVLAGVPAVLDTLSELRSGKISGAKGSIDRRRRRTITDSRHTYHQYQYQHQYQHEYLTLGRSLGSANIPLDSCVPVPHKRDS